MYKKIKLLKSFILLIFFLAITSFVKLYAQTESMYSQYMYNMLSINPAYAGNRGVIGINAFFRNQWAGIPGSPKTTSVSIDGPLNEKGLGFGFQLYDDVLGVEKTTGINGMFSTQVKVSETGVLSAGLLGGLMNYRADLTQIANRFTPNDIAFNQNYNKWTPSVGLGLFYNTDKFYAGVSIPNVLNSGLSTLDMIQSNLQKVSDMHIFITSGFVIKASDNVTIKPSTLVKMVSGAPIQFDLNTNVWLKDLFSIGVSYRTADAIVGMFEFQATKKIRFGFAYDTPISYLKGYKQSTQEFMMRFELERNRSSIKSTRYF